MVPTSCAVSGMMLFVVPETICATVITTGSKAGMRRVTILCSAMTISQATGMGSMASCGIEACPPLPFSVTISLSAAAIRGPSRLASTPLGRLGVT